MSTLTKSGRKDLSGKKFALKKSRRFPIENRKHAEAALLDAPLARRKGDISKSQEKKIDRRARKELKKR